MNEHIYKFKKTEDITIQKKHGQNTDIIVQMLDLSPRVMVKRALVKDRNDSITLVLH